MRIVCIDKKQAGRLSDVIGVTIGKVYTVHSEDDNGYKIMNDDGEFGFYWKGRFRMLNDVRLEKLNDLGI